MKETEKEKIVKAGPVIAKFSLYSCLREEPGFGVLEALLTFFKKVQVRLYVEMDKQWAWTQIGAGLSVHESQGEYLRASLSLSKFSIGVIAYKVDPEDLKEIQDETPISLEKAIADES